MDRTQESPSDETEFVIYRPWIRHPVTGQRIYPKKAKVFKIRLRK